ncbi:hypothetical protein MY4824_000207 [Beauveria thailandica]
MMGRNEKRQQPVEEIPLWRINEIHVSENYARSVTETSRVFYSRVTSRQDLPESFWEDDWRYELEAREAAERQAVSSGTSARDARGKNQGRLLSQEIANNPNIGAVISSASAAQDRRGAGRSKGMDKDKGKEKR